MSFACPIREQDAPTQVTLTSRPCGYSHNVQAVTALNTQGVVAPPWEVAVCTRPINVTRLGSRINIKDFTRWLEFWRANGAGELHLYVSEAGGKYEELLQEYQKEKLRFLKVVRWEEAERATEVVVSDEAAVNHCVMNNMMHDRYIVVTSFDAVLLFNAKYRNLKQFLRQEDVQHKFSTDGGFRVLPVELSSGLPERPVMILKSRHVLATAANHFIPLNGRPSFKILDPLDISAISVNQIGQSHIGFNFDTFIGLAAFKILKNIGIDGVI